MDFFNQVAAQVKDLYGRLTFSQKMAFVLLVTVVVGALVVFTSWGAAGEYVTVTRDPLGAARTAVVGALDVAGIRYREVAGALEVPVSQYNEAMAILATNGIVPAEQIKIRLADIAKEDKMFRTADDKRAQRLVVLQNWLADVVSQMENIRSASVALDAPDAIGWMSSEDRGTAAVHVWLRSGVDRLSNDQVNGIAALVAGVRRTIRKSDVSIIDNQGHEYRVPGDEEGGGHVGDRYEQTMLYERRLASEVRDMLAFFTPVKVMVRLKIDFDRLTEEAVEVDPTKTVEVESRRETSESTTTGPSGGAGETAPGVPAAVGAGTGGPEKSETKDTRFSKKEIYKKVTHLLKSPGDVQDLSVSVFVPRDQVIEQIKSRGIEVDEKAADPQITAELTNVKKSIMNMLLLTEMEKVTVQAVMFPKPKVVEEPASAGSSTQFWSQHGRTTVLAVLSLFALFLLWRMVKKPVEVVTGPGHAFTDEEILTGIEGPNTQALRVERIERKVTDMVRDNPGDAANLISRWAQTEG